MVNRVLVTGYGAVTSCGLNAELTWEAILAGRSGITSITNWDISAWPCHLGGELHGFDPRAMLPDRKLLKVISRQDVMGIQAAMQAVDHSEIISYRNQLCEEEPFNHETAVYVGSPGNKYYQQYDFLSLVSKSKNDMKVFSEDLFNEVHPMWLLRILPNNVLAYTGITYGFKGVNQNITNHAVSGTQAIIEAFHAIQSGYAKRAVVVAYDVATEPQALYYYDKLGVLSYRHLKPFDIEHDGTLLGEGAGAIILESEQSALERKANCFGELLGGFAATEAAGLFSIKDDGKQLMTMIKQTLEQSNLTPADVGMIVAHGNGNPKSDSTESIALHDVFGDHGTPVTGFKWATGHTICASGMIDMIMAVKSLNSNTIPGIANFKSLSKNCAPLSISNRAQPLSIPSALVINRGYASMDTCLILKSYDP